MNRIAILSISALLLITLPVSAASNRKITEDGFIEGSYIVTFKQPIGLEQPVVKPVPKDHDKAGRSPPPFGQHNTGQNKSEVAEVIGLNGEVAAIFPTINAAHVKVDAEEAERLRKHPLVINVEQDRVGVPATTIYVNPGWALDRLDETAPQALDNLYTYTSDGAGQTIYILDSGLTLSNPTVAAEFGGRASVFWDVNGGAGEDCYGHGTMVASAAAGNHYGVAKGATLKIVKITSGCGDNTTTDVSTWILAFDWLAAYAPRGTIANLSYGLVVYQNDQIICGSAINTALEGSIKKAHDAGIIVVVAAGNDGCNADNYSPTRMPTSFVVGATDSSRLSFNQDAKASYSRYGMNISTFAPGTLVRLMDQTGTQDLVNGTSFAAPYIAGVFAIACQYVAPYCTTASTADMYTGLRNTATATVTNPNGTPLTGSVSRFISKQDW